MTCAGCHLLLPLGGSEDVGPRPDVSRSDASLDAPVPPDGAGDTQPDQLVPPSGICNKDNWCWEHPLPQGNTLDGVWVHDRNDIYAVGHHGTIIHYDGKEWTRQEPNLSGPAVNLHDIWGNAGGTELWAVGADGTILHYQGGSWSEESKIVNETLRAVWGDEKMGEVWAVGDSGTVLIHDGKEWKKSQIDLGSADLRAVWGTPGSPPPEVYIGGDGGVWTGEGKVEHTPVSQPAVHGLWVDPSSTAAVAVGSIGNASWYSVRKKGSSVWSTPSGKATAPLMSVWGDGMAGKAWTVSSAGLVQQIDLASGGIDPISFTSSALGNRCIHGAAAAALPVLVTVGSLGNTWIKDGASGWMPRSSSVTDQTLNAVWGTGNHVYVVGDSGTILHRDLSEAAWKKVVDSGTLNNLEGIWGSGPSNIRAVGHKGTILLGDGASWSHGSSSPGVFFYDVWGSGPNDVYVVGDSGGQGTIQRFDGNGWKPEAPPGSPAFLGVWGSPGDDVLAVGNNEAIYRRSPGWTEVQSDAGGPTFTAVWGSGPKEVFIVSSSAASGNGTIVRYDGAGWTLDFFPADTNNLADVWGRGPDDVYAVGNSGVILHRDQLNWTEQDSGTDHALNGVWSDDKTGSGPVWVVGSSGAVLRRDP